MLSAASGVLPFCFGRQSFSFPFSILLLSSFSYTILLYQHFVNNLMEEAFMRARQKTKKNTSTNLLEISYLCSHYVSWSGLKLCMHTSALRLPNLLKQCAKLEACCWLRCPFSEPSHVEGEDDYQYDDDYAKDRWDI